MKEEVAQWQGKSEGEYWANGPNRANKANGTNRA